MDNILQLNKETTQPLLGNSIVPPLDLGNPQLIKA